MLDILLAIIILIIFFSVIMFFLIKLLNFLAKESENEEQFWKNYQEQQLKRNQNDWNDFD